MSNTVFQLEAAALEGLAQLSQVFNDQVRLAGAQLRQFVITGQDAAGKNAAMLCGVNIMLHVADEKRFSGVQMIFGQ